MDRWKIAECNAQWSEEDWVFIGNNLFPFGKEKAKYSFEKRWWDIEHISSPNESIFMSPIISIIEDCKPWLETKFSI